LVLTRLREVILAVPSGLREAVTVSSKSISEKHGFLPWSQLVRDLQAQNVQVVKKYFTKLTLHSQEESQQQCQKKLRKEKILKAKGTQSHTIHHVCIISDS